MPQFNKMGKGAVNMVCQTLCLIEHQPRCRLHSTFLLPTHVQSWERRVRRQYSATVPTCVVPVCSLTPLVFSTQNLLSGLSNKPNGNAPSNMRSIALRGGRGCLFGAVLTCHQAQKVWAPSVKWLWQGRQGRVRIPNSGSSLPSA